MRIFQAVDERSEVNDVNVNLKCHKGDLNLNAANELGNKMVLGLYWSASNDELMFKRNKDERNAYFKRFNLNQK